VVALIAETPRAREARRDEYGQSVSYCQTTVAVRQAQPEITAPQDRHITESVLVDPEVVAERHQRAETAEREDSPEAEEEAEVEA
jgi:hypothetical protein